MKRLIAILTMTMTILLSSTAVFAADEGAPCILIKFSNNTRYQNVDSASVLSDLVIEKMLASGRFNLRESKPIDEDIAAQLYDSRVREILSVQHEIDRGNFNPIFEGPAFDASQVQSLSTSEINQTVVPSLTSRIGKEHGAVYLIQGTIINMGQGHWVDEETQQAANMMSNAVGAVVPFGGLFSMSAEDFSLAVQTDLRIIEASTGKVIWKKAVTGRHTDSQTKIMGIKSGKGKIDSDLYALAMDDAANKIVEAMTKDLTLYMLYSR